jgi:hypothetical protein
MVVFWKLCYAQAPPSRNRVPSSGQLFVRRGSFESTITVQYFCVSATIVAISAETPARREMNNMLKHCVRTLVVALLLPFAAALSFAQSSDIPKIEVGAQFTTTRLRDLSETDPGMGIRFSYNITDSLAAEAEFNYFGGDLTDLSLFYRLPANTTYSTNRTQGLFGAKYMALRGDKFGIGGKFRPGFMRFNGGGNIGCPPGTTSSIFICQLAAGKTNFAMDVGGVFEYYPARRLVTRFDIGATIVRFGGPIQDGLFPPDGFNSTNPQFSAGIGFRF